MNYVATAFLFGHPVSQSSRKPSYWTFVVTNRHVVHPHRELWVRFRPPVAGLHAKPFAVPTDKPAPFPWILHPDPDVDLAVLPLDAIQMPSEFKPNQLLTLDRHAIVKEELRVSECNEGNEVFILVSHWVSLAPRKMTLSFATASLPESRTGTTGARGTFLSTRPYIQETAAAL